MDNLQPAPDGYPIKLVRDRTAEIINASGEPGDLWYGHIRAIDRTSRQSAHRKWLIKKLIEEVGEYVVDGGYRELADVLAVVEALAQVGHSMALENLMDVVRADERGGFRDGILMYGKHAEYDK